MKKLLLLSCWLLCSNIAFAQLKTYTTVIYFDTDSDQISAAQQGQLLEILSLDSIVKISLTGHTDSDASLAYNQALSKRRVRTIQEWLVQNGAQSEWFVTNYFGEEQPAQPNTNAMAKAQNRRVSIVVLTNDNLWKDKQEVTRASEPLDDQEEEETDRTTSHTIAATPRIDTLQLDNRELNEALSTSNEVQYFMISAQTGGHFETKSQIKFHFDKDVFDKDCSDSVRIEVVEYNNRADMVAGHMSTLSNRRLLYSAAMYEVKAFCRDQQLALQEGKNYTAMIPILQEEQQSDNMQLFYGERHPTTQEVNWRLGTGRERIRKVDWGGSGSCGSKCWVVQLFYMMRCRRKIRLAKRRFAKQLKGFKEKYANVPIEDMDMATAEKIQYYIIEPTSMGLINCDAFLDTPPEQMMVQQVTIEGQKIENNTDVRLVFAKRRSVIIYSTVTTEGFAFSNIPKDIEAYVVATKITQQNGNTKVYLGIKNIQTTVNKTANVIMEEVATIKELHQRLKFMQ